MFNLTFNSTTENIFFFFTVDITKTLVPSMHCMRLNGENKNVEIKFYFVFEQHEKKENLIVFNVQ